jgi:hypothetical protein
MTDDGLADLALRYPLLVYYTLKGGYPSWTGMGLVFKTPY